jgi:hypothetical protein
MSSRRAETGSASGKSIGGKDAVRRVKSVAVKVEGRSGIDVDYSAAGSTAVVAVQTAGVNALFEALLAH